MSEPVRVMVRFNLGKHPLLVGAACGAIGACVIFSAAFWLLQNSYHRTIRQALRLIDCQASLLRHEVLTPYENLPYEIPADEPCPTTVADRIASEWDQIRFGTAVLNNEVLQASIADIPNSQQALLRRYAETIRISERLQDRYARMMLERD